MDYIFQLPLPARRQPMARDIRFFPGHRYRIDLPEADINPLADPEYALQKGLIGAYRPGLNATEIEAVDISAHPTQAFVWDVELLNPRLTGSLQLDTGQPRATDFNRLNLLDARMAAPEVRLIRNLPTLSICPRLELEWRTAAHASQLGIVQLLESTRALLLANGESVVLQDTETAGNGPVLLLDDTADHAAVKPVCGFQAQGEQRRFEFSHAVSQLIPAEIDGQAVTSVSVLEKYTLYFMQNADPEQPHRFIWVPVHLPIVWGWSIRVQQRYDGVWDIFRKKLIMPIPSTEAPSLPRWQSNSLRCRIITEL